MSNEKIMNLAMNDNGFIFDPNSGFSYTANETGLLVLRLLNLGKSESEIIQEIASVYDVTEDQASSDLDHYFLMLQALDLVKNNEES